MKRKPLSPPHPAVHPTVRLMQEAIERSGMSLLEVATRAGYYPQTLYSWRMGHTTPSLPDLEAVFNAAGYNLSITVKDRA